MNAAMLELQVKGPEYLQVPFPTYTAVGARSNAGRFHWIMGSIVSGCVALGYAVAPVSQVVEALSTATACLYLAAAVVFFGWLGYERVYNALSVCMWAIVFLLCTGPLLYTAGSTSYPLIDSALARYDVVSTAAISRWTDAHANWISGVVYMAIGPLAAAALILPPVFRHKSERFLIAVTIGALVMFAVFAIAPAAGPWTVEGYQPTAFQAQVSAQLAALKAHQVATLRTSSIVSFPSFHTILAILSAFALWPIRWLRWPAVILAAGICVSTVTTGWHYGIDVISGAVVALFAQWVAERLA